MAEKLCRILKDHNLKSQSVNEIFKCTKDEFRRIREVLASPDDDQVTFTNKIENAFLAPPEVERIDEATTDPAVLVMSTQRSRIVPWLLGGTGQPVSYFSDSKWTDKACVTVYQHHIEEEESLKIDHVNIYPFGDDDEIQQRVLMNGSGLEPAEDWPASIGENQCFPVSLSIVESLASDGDKIECFSV